MEDLQGEHQHPPSSTGREQPPATLSVNNHHSSVAGGRVTMGCPLEEATEYEYLRNILYQYMLGKESQTLARVLATVVKFTPEQMAKIEQSEERRKGLLGTLGLSGAAGGGGGKS